MNSAPAKSVARTAATAIRSRIATNGLHLNLSGGTWTLHVDLDTARNLTVRLEATGVTA